MKDIHLMALLTFCLSACLNAFAFGQEGSQIVKQEPVGKLSADAQVDRGLVLSQPGSSHSISLQSWELTGLPPLGNLSNQAKLTLAVREFRSALLRQDELKGYTPAQVRNFLGRANLLLGIELTRQSEKSQRKKPELDKKARHYFAESKMHYRLAIRDAPEALRYIFAADLVRAVMASGDLNQALTLIDDFEGKQIKPHPMSEHSLLRIKAEIYWIMSRPGDAGLVYEEWIRRGNTESFLSANNAVFSRLHDLKRETGHPNNLPPQEPQTR